MAKTDPVNELVKIMNRRLKEADKFWYQSLEEYNDIENFLSSLNALIQALRNITFILQANKELIIDFETWYSKEQEIMREDQVLRWLVETRNKIVKQKDLELKSIATVSLKNWLEMPLFAFEVPAVKKDKEIYEWVLNGIESNREKFVFELREPVLEIKRNWIVEDLPNHEILSGLSYCYKKLKDVVVRSYQQTNIKNFNVQIEKDNSILIQHTPDEKRMVLIDLKDGSNLEFSRNTIQLDNKMIEKAEERYGITTKRQNKVEDLSDPFLQLDNIIPMAKKILQTDGHHVPIVWYFFDSKSPEITVIPTEDKTQLYAIIRRISEEIKIRNITGLIFILESWVYNLNKKQEDIKNEKGEVLGVWAIRNDGRFESHLHNFSRNQEGSITITKTDLDTDLKNNYWLRPIVESLGIK